MNMYGSSAYDPSEYGEIARQRHILSKQDLASLTWGDVEANFSPAEERPKLTPEVIKNTFLSTEGPSTVVKSGTRGHQHKGVEVRTSTPTKNKLTVTTLPTGISSGCFGHFSEFQSETVQALVYEVQPGVSEWQKRAVFMSPDPSNGPVPLLKLGAASTMGTPYLRIFVS